MLPFLIICNFNFISTDRHILIVLPGISMTKKHKKRKLLAESETGKETIAARQLLFMTTRKKKYLTSISILRKHTLLKMKRSA